MAVFSDLTELNLSCNYFEEHWKLFSALAKADNLEKVYLKRIGLQKPQPPSLFDEEKEVELKTQLASKNETFFADFVKKTGKLKVVEFGENELWPALLQKMTQWKNLGEKIYIECF